MGEQNPLSTFLQWLGFMEQEEEVNPKKPNIRKAISRLKGQPEDMPMPQQAGPMPAQAAALRQAILPPRGLPRGAGPGTDNSLDLPYGPSMQQLANPFFQRDVNLPNLSPEHLAILGQLQQVYRR